MFYETQNMVLRLKQSLKKLFYCEHELGQKSLEVYGSRKIFQDGTLNFYILTTDLRIEKTHIPSVQ